jgi:hypothetical protein
VSRSADSEATEWHWDWIPQCCCTWPAQMFKNEINEWSTYKHLKNQQYYTQANKSKQTEKARKIKGLK